MTVELPRESLELVLSALEKVATRLPEDPSRSLFAKAADPLVQMARETLVGDNATSPSAESHQVVVHGCSQREQLGSLLRNLLVEASALSGQGRESDLPLPTVKRLFFDGAVVPVLEVHGKPLDVVRKRRMVPTAIKRALTARDRRCTFPGCHHERFLEAHHVHHWAEGGETSLSNLLMLCSAHHALSHRGGFSVQRRRDGTCYFTRPDGRPVASFSAEGAVRAVESSAEDQHEARDARAVYRISSLERAAGSFGRRGLPRSGRSTTTELGRQRPDGGMIEV